MYSLKNYGILTKKKTPQKTTSHTNKESLRNIQGNENIIIKEANKENAVVILDKTYYRTKI